MFIKIFAVIGLLVLLFPSSANAQTSEHVESFNSKITVNEDSSLDIEEEIEYYFPLARHGIFRILPTQMHVSSDKTQNTPIKLISITNQNGEKIQYRESKQKSDHTITWKIGDPNKTVEGFQIYKIHYKVFNAIRFGNPDFDELYWNLNGNFWEVPIKGYTASINFPAEITASNTKTYLYSGQFGSNDNNLANYSWVSGNTLEVRSLEQLNQGDGITVSVTTPKNIFIEPPPTFWDKYGLIIQMMSLLIPIFILILSIVVWSRYGRDPKIAGPVVPEFNIPENLTPLQMGVLMRNGGFDNKYISAAIVSLAVKKVLKIEETAKKKYSLTLLKKENSDLSAEEKILVEKLFKDGDKVNIDELENKFYKDIPDIQSPVNEKLKNQGLLAEKGWCAVAIYWSLVVVFFILLIVLGGISGWLTISLALSFLILLIFSILMPRRTVAGAKLMKKVEGFKLYMKTAERYRQEFNEKENIFEKYLPYAMVFGIVSEWTKSFAQLYREVKNQDYFAAYHPVWFASAVSGKFDSDFFNSSMTSLSNKMSSTLSSSPSSSGSGGGGFSGGGGGGGGGGSW